MHVIRIIIQVTKKPIGKTDCRVLEFWPDNQVAIECLAFSSRPGHTD